MVSRGRRRRPLLRPQTSKLPAHTEDDESAHVQDPVDLDFSKEDTVECVMGTLHYCIEAKPEHIVTESSNIAHLAIDDLSATFRVKTVEVWRSVYPSWLNGVEEGEEISDGPPRAFS